MLDGEVFQYPADVGANSSACTVLYVAVIVICCSRVVKLVVRDIASYSSVMEVKRDITSYAAVALSRLVEWRRRDMSSYSSGVECKRDIASSKSCVKVRRDITSSVAVLKSRLVVEWRSKGEAVTICIAVALSRIVVE